MTPTPGQTIGPFFHRALEWAMSESAANDPALGAIVIEGTLEDGTGEPLPAWLVEAWVPQAAAVEAEAGYATPGLRRMMGHGRDRFTFRVPRPDPGQPAAFITVFGVGLTRQHFTAVFLDEASTMLEAVSQERRATLLAEPVSDELYRWVIRTQGERETVFFSYC